MTGPVADPMADFVPGHLAADVAAADGARIAEGADLMAVAADALARACARRLRRRRGRVSGARVVLLVGAGNNGGDALLAGALLRRRGVAVTALLCAAEHHDEGARRLRRSGGLLLQLREDDPLPGRVRDVLAGADLLVDGVLGIGARGAVRGAAAGVLRALAGPGDTEDARGTTLPRPASVVACDLPSGLDPDTGLTEGPVLAADVTVTFGAAKAGLLLPWARPLLGRVEVVDLGLGAHLPGPAVRRLRVGRPHEPAPGLRRLWPQPGREADKYSRGVLGVVAGEPAYPGAAVLTATAAVATGTGMVRLVPPSHAPELGRLVLQSVPEVVVQPLDTVGRVQAWVAGPGTSGEPDERVDHVLRVADEPAVVDAGALTGLVRALSEGRLREPHRLLLTPHAGELDRLLEGLGEAPAGPGGRWAAVRLAAARTGATVLLKGAETMVVQPDGSTTVVPGGPSWLATAGAGDVLAGVAGTLLAAGLPPAAAGVLAAHVHAVAAHRASAGGPLRALAVADTLAGVLSGAVPVGWDHG